MNEELLRVEHLYQYFPAGGHGKNKKYVQAVDDVSFFINKGETLGLVGESGCGKTTTGRSLLRLYEPTKGRIIYDGKVLFDSGNVPLTNEDGIEVMENGKPKFGKKTTVDMKPYRREMQIVFQDPYASLDPRMTVGDIVGEAIDIHGLAANKQERYDKIQKLLECVGSALDVSIQAQVVNMFEDLQQQMGLTYLFIAHDLSVVKHISNRIGVMYLGKLVELADSNELIFHNVHPYTRSLISAIPIADPQAARANKRIVLEGDVPSPLNPPSGCRFRTRCPYATKQCAQEVPEWREVNKGHFAACHNLDKVN